MSGQAKYHGFLDALSEVIAALDEIPFPVALLDEGGMIRWHNKASNAVPGCRAGRDFAELAAPLAHGKAHAVLRGVLAGGEPVEFAAQAPDGAASALRSKLSVIPVRGGGRAVLLLRLVEPRDPACARPGSIARIPLTPRQLDVLQRLGEGESTHEIARSLSLSPTTVRNHVAKLLVALGVHSRLQAVAVARAGGILDP